MMNFPDVARGEEELSVIPELKLTDRGLVDTVILSLVSLEA
jgi:adenine deaminase